MTDCLRDSLSKLDVTLHAVPTVVDNQQAALENPKDHIGPSWAVPKSNQHEREGGDQHGASERDFRKFSKCSSVDIRCNELRECNVPPLPKLNDAGCCVLMAMCMFKRNPMIL